MLPIYENLNQRYLNLTEANIRIFNKPASLIGNNGYSEGMVTGTEPVFINYLSRNVNWLEPSKQRLKEGTACMEAVLAGKLGLKTGDYLTIQARTDSGMINTLQVMVDGIFIGSNLIYEDSIFINIKDQNLLFMTDNQVNEVRTYFKQRVGDDAVIAVVKAITHQFFKLAIFTSPRLEPTKDSLFAVFGYYRYISVFVFYLLNLVFLIILYFAVQNMFFMSFRERRQEISTLLTYGMKPSRLLWIAFWESLFIFGAALISAVFLAALLILLLGNVAISDPNISDLIIVLGGPRLRFALEPATVSLMVGFLMLTTLYSAYKGTKNYLKMEIREIISNV